VESTVVSGATHHAQRSSAEGYWFHFAPHIVRGAGLRLAIRQCERPFALRIAIRAGEE
jgi:hypothetical protein